MNERKPLDAIVEKAIAHIEEESWTTMQKARIELLEFQQKVIGLATLLDFRRTIN